MFSIPGMLSRDAKLKPELQSLLEAHGKGSYFRGKIGVFLYMFQVGEAVAAVGHLDVNSGELLALTAADEPDIIEDRLDPRGNRPFRGRLLPSTRVEISVLYDASSTEPRADWLKTCWGTLCSKNARRRAEAVASTRVEAAF